MTTDYTTDELRRRASGAQLRAAEHIRDALDDVRGVIDRAPSPLCRDQFGAVELKLVQASELLRLIVP
jgi:hypothetical protein